MSQLYKFIGSSDTGLYDSFNKIRLYNHANLVAKKHVQVAVGKITFICNVKPSLG